MLAITKQLIKGLIRLSEAGIEKGATVDRFVMYERIKEAFTSAHLPSVPRVLSVSYSMFLTSLVTPERAEVVQANYPQHDILNLVFADNSFDIVLADQVLEHIKGDPQRAIDETLRVLKPGGIAVHTTCLLNEIHDPEGDYWRFTPDGLALLCRNFSRIIQCEGWGNRLAFFAFRFYPVPLKRWHPIYKIATKHDPEALISTWIVAQK